MATDTARFEVIRFLEPVGDEVLDANAELAGTMIPTIIPGALAGIVDNDYGSVYPFADEAAAWAALPEFPADADPSDLSYNWEAHYSTEYVTAEKGDS